MLRLLILGAAALPQLGTDPTAFSNFETPQVQPMVLRDDGAVLLVCNTADERLLVFDVQGAAPLLVAEVPVGLDPVSVRWRTTDEAWVVNHVSDSVSIVDVPTARVVATLATADEPCDVVFAGAPQRAFVSCSQANVVHVFDPAQRDAPPLVVRIAAEDPRALAVSADGTEVYVAVFESGNATTILGGGLFLGVGSYPPNAVGDLAGPWAGATPPPNAGNVFSPALSAGLSAPPKVGLIVRRNALENWSDDNAGDWTRHVTGDRAVRSGRRPGWDLLDHDLAVIDLNPHLDYLTPTVAPALRVNSVGDPRAVVWSADGTTMWVAGMGSNNVVAFEPSGARIGPPIQLGEGPTGLALDDAADVCSYSSALERA